MLMVRRMWAFTWRFASVA